MERESDPMWPLISELSCGDGVECYGTFHLSNGHALYGAYCYLKADYPGLVGIVSAPEDGNADSPLQETWVRLSDIAAFSRDVPVEVAPEEKDARQRR